MAKILLLAIVFVGIILSTDAGKRRQEWEDYIRDDPSKHSYGTFVDDFSKDFNDFSKKFKKGGKHSDLLGKLPLHGHYKPHLHPFFTNISADELKGFSEIILNHNLTKLQLRNSLEQWASGIGAEAGEQFRKMEEHRDKLRQSVKDKTTELLSSLTTLYNKLLAIKDNMNITRADEREQISNALKHEAPLTIKILRIIERATFQEAKEQFKSMDPKLNPTNV